MTSSPWRYPAPDRTVAGKQPELVRILPEGCVHMSRSSDATGTTWTNYRVICDCQRHARTEFWSKALRVAAKTVAALVTLPLALAAFDLPTSAMNLNVGSIASPSFFRGDRAVVATAAEEDEADASGDFPIFTTPAVREQFLSGREDDLSLEVFREQYFRRHIPYGAIIHREARRHNLSPELVAAIIHTESDFRPHLVSHKEAQGLMQIIPSTARLLGLTDPFDPEKNIAAGTRYYRYLLNRFNDPTLALAAYNAGEGNVRRFGGIPPFAETQSYVVKVRRHMSNYRQRVHRGYTASLGITPEEQ